MSLNDIKSITVEEADKLYKEIGLAFVVRDGKLKGFTK